MNDKFDAAAAAALRDLEESGNDSLIEVGELIGPRSKFFLILPEQDGQLVQSDEQGDVFAGAAMMGGNGSLSMDQIAEGLRYVADYIDAQLAKQRARGEQN